MKSKAVVLLSGGLDSLTCLLIAKDQGYEVHALSFDYGQRNHSELNAAQKIAEYYQIKSHKIIRIDLAAFGGSALTDHNISVPEYSGDHQTPVTYVPARNTIFLANALAFAEVIAADAIFIGVSHIDYSGYPDCRPEYINAFTNMANLATKRAVEGKPIKIMTPLIHLSKAETIKKGLSLGADYSFSVSCYRADAKGYACGSCDSCTLRKQGFSAAGVVDVTRYQLK